MTRLLLAPAFAALLALPLRDVAAQSPAPTPAPAPAPVPADTVAAPKLELMVGDYEAGPGRILTISLEEGKLYGQPEGNEKRVLVHRSGATFAVGRADAPMTVTFVLDEQGHATALVMRQNGRERMLMKVR